MRRMANLPLPFGAGWHSVARPLCASAALALLLSCGGGGGGGGGGNTVLDEQKGVSTGFTGDLNWEVTGGGADGGVGGGADGDGGVGGGGDFGQFRNAMVVVKFPNGTELGRAPTDPNTGMVTIKPGKSYQGPLYLELQGGPNASYYEEGKGDFVPFPAGTVIRVWVPKITKNIGITPFTDAGFRLLTEGSTPERATGTPSAEQIGAANNKIRDVLNQQFPASLRVDDITRLPFIKSPSIAAGTISTDPRGIYGLVNGAFSKQAAMFNANEPAPTLAALKHFGEDMLDGKLDGMRDAQPAVPAGNRTYDAHTYTGELSSALAEQSYRFGDNSAVLALPKLLNYGNSRYEGYLFDASLRPDGSAYNTVAGWVNDNAANRKVGDSVNKLPNVSRVFGVFGNFGHGSVFMKTDAPNSQSKVYAVGDNTNGELGLGHRTSTAGQAVELALPNVLTHIAGGFAHTVARLADGTVYTWGDNSYSQLGQGVDGSTLARSETPVKVNLPAGAVAVAATNTASYALLDDGRVYSWGSSLGFGLLGDGTKDSVRSTPGPVMTTGGALADVVQIAARDNDAIVLRRDGTVLNWGSFPADEAGGYVDSDVSAPYNGGTPLPAPVAGLPSGVQVRKLLTEQGLFAALMSDGAVYTWGVHFDITADGILRDLVPARVLGLAPVRDLMPGGFIGYGQRPFDRMTAMAIDPRGGMWKVRGRVAEQFDPANPTQQRRPQGQAPRNDCKSCHLVLTDWPLTAPAPTNSASCVPPSSIHGGSGSPSLIHSDTKCEQCHNPSRITPTLTTGWLNCVRPSDLPVRTNPTTPPIQSTACTIPAGHVYTPPGTVCSSCHNSIVARPLSCAQPSSSTLPSIATTARIVSAVNDDNATIAAGSTTRDATPTLQGTLSAALASGQSVRVLRNGAAAGSATVNGTSWSYTDSGAGNGSQTYSARVEAGSAFGSVVNTYAIVIDTVAPSVSANVTAIADDISGTVPPGGTTSDTTPTVLGSSSATLGSGESIRLLRNGVAIATFSASGASWSYTEPTALAQATYDYQAQVIDAAGNAGAAGTSQRVTINTSVPLPNAATTITTVNAAALGGASSVAPNNDTTPTIAGAIQRALNAAPAEVVRVYRNGEAVGVATVTGTSWTYTSPALADGTYTFLARIEQSTNSAVFAAASNSVSDPIDATPPRQTITATAIGKVAPFANADRTVPGYNAASVISGLTNDPNPTIRLQFSAPLASGETLEITRELGADKPASITAKLRDCGTNCVEFDDTPGVKIGTPALGSPNEQLPTKVQYTVRVRDAAGNVSPAGTSSPLAFSFGYFACNRARVAHTDNKDCAGCHRSFVNDQTNAFFVAAPPATSLYWCTP